MKNKLTKKLTLLFLICSTSVFSQETYTNSQLREDLGIFKTILVNTSPVLNVGEKKQMEKSFRQAIDTFSVKQGSATSLAKMIMHKTLNTKLDGHAGVSFAFDKFPKDSVFFPIPIYIIDNHVLVNVVDSKIPYGSIIDSINGKDIKDIFDDLRSDDQERYYYKNIYNTSFTYALFVQIGAAKSFKVSYRNSPTDTSGKTVVVMGITSQNYQEQLTKRVFPITKQDYKNLLVCNFDNDSKTYYLGIAGFRTPIDSLNESGYYEYIFDNAFKDIQDKKALHLIIDLRDNGGGLMIIAGHILRYLRQAPFSQTFRYNLPPVKNIPLQHLKRIGYNYVMNPEESKKIIDNIYRPFKKINGGYVLEETYTTQPDSLAFKNDVYLLVNGGTFSAASYFASLFKAYNIGKIVGSPVGGEIKGITAGQMLIYELPNTKLGVEVPLENITFDRFLYDRVPGNHIKPDIEYPFELKYKYFLAKVDCEINEIISGFKKK